MEALHDVVRAGKARYIGASSMWAWQFAKAQHAADLGGWTRFVSMQDQYNLVQREEEREMHPLCLDQGVGVIPWSPLARGKLTRDWDATTARHRDGPLRADPLQAAGGGRPPASPRPSRDVAEERGVSRAQVALAWVRQQEAVAAPIVGATKTQHLDDAVASVDLWLDDDELDALRVALRHPGERGLLTPAAARRPPTVSRTGGEDADRARRTEGPHGHRAPRRPTSRSTAAPDRARRADGAAQSRLDETRSTSSEKDGSYVDSDIPEDGTTAGGPHDGEADGKFTDSDIPGDR